MRGLGEEYEGVWTINIPFIFCCLHFTEESFHFSEKKRLRKTDCINRILKKDSVSTIFDCFPECLQPTHSKRKAPAVQELPIEKKNKPSSPTVEQHIGSDHDHCQCVESLKIEINALKVAGQAPFVFEL